MAQNLPPSENLPIFDDSVFQTNNTPLTYSQAIKKFLTYPNAQGTETLQAVNVNGTATFLNNNIFKNGTSTFQENVIIENSSTGGVRTLSFNDIQTGQNSIMSNSAGNFLLTTPNLANTITMNCGGVQPPGLILSGTTLVTNVPTPATTDNSNKIATTAWVQSAPKIASGLSVQLNNTAVNPYSFPMVSGVTAGNYTPLSITSNLSLVPSTATLNMNGTITSNLFRTNPNGTVRIYDAGGVIQTQLSQNGQRFVTSLPTASEFTITSSGQGPLPIASAFGATSIMWNGTNGGGESDIINYQGAGASGGFNFYVVTPSLPATKIATITKTQPLPSDNSTNLATTAWVQSAISSMSIPRLTYYLPAPMNPSGSLTNGFAVINNVPQSAFTQVSGVIPPSYKFRISFNLYSTDYLIAYSFCGELDIYPSRLTNTNPIVAGDTSFTTGNITTNNLTNAIAGLSTSYNYTNATYSPYNRFFWTSCQNGGFISGGSTTWLYIYAQWSSAVGGTSNIFLNYIIPGYNATPTAINPTNGFSLSQTAMFNYTTEYLGTNTAGGVVQLF